MSSPPQPATSRTQLPEVQFSLHEVPPPSPLYISPGDYLAVRVYAPTGSATSTAELNARLLLANGQIQVIRERLTGLDSGPLRLIPLTEGFLLSVAVRMVASGIAQPGAQLCQVTLRRETGIIGASYWSLISDYITTGYLASWPPGRNISPLSGPGLIRSITGTNPAAGAEISETVPIGTRWRLIALQATLVTDATVSNRVAEFVIDDGANVFYTSGSPSVQPAGATTAYSLAAAAIRAAAGLFTTFLPLPFNPLLATGFRIRSVTGNFQAGDNWGAPQILVEEWVQN